MSSEFTPTIDQVRRAADWDRDHIIKGDEFDRWLRQHDAEVRSEAAAEVGTAFAEWAAENEIAEPPLDWARFGELVRWSGSPVHEGVSGDE